MSEVKKIATRESYGNALVELGAEHDNLIVLDADLAAATKTGVFKKAYPDRHIDCGIAAPYGKRRARNCGMKFCYRQKNKNNKAKLGFHTTFFPFFLLFLSIPLWSL